MFWVYGHYKYFYFYIFGIHFRCQTLTTNDSHGNHDNNKIIIDFNTGVTVYRTESAVGAAR